MTVVFFTGRRLNKFIFKFGNVFTIIFHNVTPFEIMITLN